MYSINVNNLPPPPPKFSLCNKKSGKKQLYTMKKIIKIVAVKLLITFLAHLYD